MSNITGIILNGAILIGKFTAKDGSDEIFDVKVNSSIISTKRTYFGSELFCTFKFSVGDIYGRKLVANDELSISTTNYRPTASDFEARFYGILVAE